MKILVVDDSKAMRMIVKRTLRQAGFGDAEIEEADNGAKGLTAVKASLPDFILCDWNMPEMSGIEFLKALRAEGFDVKFGFITSVATPEITQEGMDAGAAFVIGKPFSADKLKSAIERA